MCNQQQLLQLFRQSFSIGGRQYNFKLQLLQRTSSQTLLKFTLKGIQIFLFTIILSVALLNSALTTQVL